jgi:CDP-diacylglycerol---serine O-phosphatidyltransferase
MKKSMIPNGLTFLNLSCGILAILFTLTDRPDVSAILIIIAGLIDRYDGRIARFFDAESPLGKELDSLADLVSFGAAPSILGWSLFLSNLSNFEIIGYIIAILFPIAGAFRLARYNVTEFNDVFTGIPITAAGSLMALDSLITVFYVKHYLISSALMLFLSYMMVSKFKFKKF